MRKVQDEKHIGCCPACGRHKEYTGHDFDDDYLWKYDNWKCDCGARGFDASMIVYSDTCWEVE